VRVRGLVTEFQGKTEITDVLGVEVISGGNPLPTAAEISFPVASVIDAGGTLVADLEMYEGMRVTIPQEMTVGDVFTLGRFGEIDLSALGRIPAYTQVNAPDADGLQAYLEEAVRNAIILDDGSSVQNPSVVPFEIAGEPGNIPGEFDAADELASPGSSTSPSVSTGSSRPRRPSSSMPTRARRSRPRSAAASRWPRSTSSTTSRRSSTRASAPGRTARNREGRTTRPSSSGRPTSSSPRWPRSAPTSSA
jgi:hypothetical protein